MFLVSTSLPPSWQAGPAIEMQTMLLLISPAEYARSAVELIAVAIGMLPTNARLVMDMLGSGAFRLNSDALSKLAFGATAVLPSALSQWACGWAMSSPGRTAENCLVTPVSPGATSARL